MAFLNPLLIWGLALGAIPILIHLLQRRRFRVRRWAAMAFLQLSVRNTARRLRLEQLLLLILRAAILMLAALALARPVVSSSGLSLLARHAPIHATILLDNSYSMGLVSAGGDRRPTTTSSDQRPTTTSSDQRPTTNDQRPTTDGQMPSTRFERARARALELIRDGLRQGDSVSVILAGDPPQALIMRPTFDLAAAARQIRATRLGDEGTNFDKVARLCLETLKGAPHPNREVYLITDNQAVGWEPIADFGLRIADLKPGQRSPIRNPQSAIRNEGWREIAGLARLHVVPVGEAQHGIDRDRVLALGSAPETPRNVTVAGVEASRGLVSTHTPTTIEARIANHGDRAQSGLLATLVINGRAIASTRVDLPPHGVAFARFTHLFPTAGIHAGSVRVTADRLLRDDEAYFRLQVRDRVAVLCLNGHPSVEPQQDAAFYLVYALSPAIATGVPGLIQPTVVPGTHFGGANLRQYQVVILADVASLGGTDSRALEHFVQDGGGALVFLGGRRPTTTSSDQRPTTNDQRPTTNGQVATKGLLGVSYRPVVHAPAHPVALDPSSIDHPTLARFRKAADLDLGTATFARTAAVDAGKKEDALHVLCRFTDGTPAIVEKRHGQGRILFVAGTAGADGSTLPYKPAYLPLLHQLVGYLAQGPDGPKNLTVGDRLVKTLEVTGSTPAAGPLRLTGPDGNATSLQPAALGPGGSRAVRFDGARRAGLYRLEAPGAATRAPLEIFAVNLPPGEGDLRPVSRDQLTRLLPGTRFWWIDPNQPLADALRQSRLGVELWRPLVLAVMALMFLESFLAQRFGRQS
jgi:hypothetical protein